MLQDRELVKYTAKWPHSKVNQGRRQSGAGLARLTSPAPGTVVSVYLATSQSIDAFLECETDLPH